MRACANLFLRTSNRVDAVRRGAMSMGSVSCPVRGLHETVLSRPVWGLSEMTFRSDAVVGDQERGPGCDQGGGGQRTRRARGSHRPHDAVEIGLRHSGIILALMAMSVCFANGGGTLVVFKARRRGVRVTGGAVAMDFALVNHTSTVATVRLANATHMRSSC